MCHPELDDFQDRPTGDCFDQYVLRTQIALNSIQKVRKHEVGRFKIKVRVSDSCVPPTVL